MPIILTKVSLKTFQQKSFVNCMQKQCDITKFKLEESTLILTYVIQCSLVINNLFLSPTVCSLKLFCSSL